MGITKVKLKQLENAGTIGSIPAAGASNILTYIAPLAENHLWGYEHGSTETLPIKIGTNLAYDTLTNTLNASAGAGGYATIQEEGSTVGGSNTTINFVGSGITAADAGGGVTSVTINTFLNTLATSGSVSLTTHVTGDLPFANLAQGSALSVLGVAGNVGADNASIAAANDFEVLRRSGSTIGFGAINLASANAVSGILDETNGGTGQSTITTGDILYGSAANTLSKLGIGAASTYLKGGATPSWATLNIAALSDGATIATQTYVNDLIAGIRKGSVRVATTTAGTLATSFENGDIVDGVTLATGDLILIKNQAASAENGVYTVNVSGAPTRASWMDTASEIDGVYVAVEDGTANAGTLWITVSDVTTLGTDPIVFTQIQTSGTVLGSAGVTNTLAWWSAANTIDDAQLSWTDGSRFALGTVSAAASTTLTTKGTDDLNTAFGILHQNNSGTQVFRVSNTGTVVIGTGTTATITGTTLTGSGAYAINTSGTITLTPTSTNGVTINNGNGGTFTFGSGYTWNGGSGTLRAASTSSIFAPTSGTATFTSFAVLPTINQTGGANGISRGILISPTITAAADYRGLEITTGSTHYALWTTLGKVRFDFTTNAIGDLLTRDTNGELTPIAASTAGYVLTSNGAATKPTWQAAASATAVTRAYKTTFTGTTITLNSGTDVTNKDGTNIAFATLGLSADQIFVVKNGVLLSESGTVGRDYTINTTSSVLTLAETAVSSDEFLIYKIV